MNFFVRLGEIHSLDLVGDQCFITRIFPLVPRGLLQLLAECLRDKANWVSCKVRVLEEYFPYFVRERLVRNLCLIFTRVGSQYAHILIGCFKLPNFCNTKPLRHS